MTIYGSYGEAILPAYTHAVDVAVAMPDRSLSHLTVLGSPPPSVEFEISPYTPNPEATRMSTLSMIDGRSPRDEQRGTFRMSSNTKFSDGVRACTVDADIHIPDALPRGQFDDVEPPSLPERTIEALRHVGEHIGRLAIPIRKLRVAIITPELGRILNGDTVDRSPTFTRVEAEITTEKEKGDLRAWTDSLLVLRRTSVRAVEYGPAKNFIDVETLEGGHPFTLDVEDRTPEGLAAWRQAVEIWNSDNPANPYPLPPGS